MGSVDQPSSTFDKHEGLCLHLHPAGCCLCRPSVPGRTRSRTRSCCRTRTCPRSCRTWSWPCCCPCRTPGPCCPCGPPCPCCSPCPCCPCCPCCPPRCRLCCPRPC